jgi:hypothetical protein
MPWLSKNYFPAFLKLGTFFLFSIFLTFSFSSFALAQGNEERPSEKNTSSSQAELNGDTVEYSVDGNRVTAKGNVVIKYQNATLTCDKVEFFRNTSIAKAEGHVHLRSPQGELSGDRLTYNFEKMTGEFSGTKIMADPYYGYGRKVQKINDNEIVMSDGYLTTCDLDKPHYKMAPKTVHIYPKEKIVARNSKFILGSMPVMWFPRFTQRLDHKEPIFTFTPGYTKDWGAFLLTQYHFNLNEYLKGIIHLDARERRDIASGLDLNYKIPNMGEGQIETYYMNERKLGVKHFFDERTVPTTERERFKGEWRHKWDIDDKTATILQYVRLSDSDILKDYFKREYDKDSSPQTYFLLTRQLNAGVFSFRAEQRVNRFEEGIDRLPEIRYDSSNQRIGESRFYFKTITSYSNLAHKFPSPTEVRLETQRLDSDNELSYQTKIGIIEFKPFIGGRETFYSKTAVEDENNVFRGIFKTGASLSTKFYKVMNVDTEIFGVPIHRLRHVITPSIDYSYVHDPTIPSSKLNIFDSSIDSQERDHTITFGIENKLQTKRGDKVVDLARMLVSTDFLLKEDPSGGGFNLIKSEADVKPFDWLSLYFDSEYNTRKEKLTIANFDVFLNDPVDSKWTLGVGKRFNADVDDQVTAQVTYKLNRMWKLRAYDRFDVDGGIQKEQDFTLTRDLHCWEMDINFNETRGQGSEIWFVFRLKAFPEMAIDAGTSFNKRKAGSQSGTTP